MKKSRIDLTRLGNQPDSELSRLWGMTKTAVRNLRVEQGIPACGQRIEWSLIDVDLGTMSDRDVSVKHGIKFSTVFSRRKKLGVKAFKPERCYQEQTIEDAKAAANQALLNYPRSKELSDAITALQNSARLS